jgi:hypothetical protein
MVSEQLDGLMLELLLWDARLRALTRRRAELARDPAAAAAGGSGHQDEVRLSAEIADAVSQIRAREHALRSRHRPGH